MATKTIKGIANIDDPVLYPIRNVILPDAKKQPDRSLAIVMASVVESELSDMLVGKLVDHKRTIEKFFMGMGPLSSFSAKIDLGFLLGLYGDDIGKMLHGIRNIRNAFAHDMKPLDFKSLEIIAKMKPLAFVNHVLSRRKPLEGRELFIAACEFSLGAIYTTGRTNRRFRSPEPSKKPTSPVS